MELFCIIAESFAASHLVKNHRIHFFESISGSPHENIGNTAINNHLRAEETWPYLREIIGCDIESCQIEGASACMFSCLEERVHLCVYAPAALIV